jgi:uncharacterized protein (TIGR00369 family)
MIGAAQLEGWIGGSPFLSSLGLAVDGVSEGALTLRMPLAPTLLRGGDIAQFHGGPIASLIDTVGDFVVALDAGRVVPTVNFRVDYLRPATGAALRGVGRLRRLGKSLAVVDIDVLDDEGRLCALGRACYAV